MKSFRNGYFDDYIFEEKVQTDGKVRRGYRYRGYWYTFCDTEQEKVQTKVTLAVLELISIAAFAFAGTRPVAFNAGKVLGGMLGLSVAAWLAELSGVFSFCISKMYLSEGSYKSIDNRIMYGSLIRGILLLAAVVCGFVFAGGWSPEAAPAISGYLLSVCMSFTIRRVQGKVMFHIFRNENGKVGNEY